MKTHEVISIKESELVAKLKEMPLEELEKHARNIMLEMGEENYSAVMSQVMKAVQDGSQPGISQFELVQNTLRDALPNQAYMSDIYARLGAIVMMVLRDKFQAIYAKQ